MSDTLNSLNDALTEKEEPSLFKSVIGTIGMLVAFPLAAKAMMGGMYRLNLAAGRTLTRVAESNTLNSFARKLSTDGATYRSRNIGRTIYRTTNVVRDLANRSVRTSKYTLNHGSLSDPAVVQKLSHDRMFIKGAAQYRGLARRGNPYAVDSRANVADLRITSMLSNTRFFRHTPMIRDLMKRTYRMENMSSKILKDNRSIFSPLVSGATRAYAKGDIVKARGYAAIRGAASSLPAFYAMDAMMGRTDGKWYHPATMAKWAASMVPFDLAFRGVGPAFGMVKKGFGKAMGGVIKSGLNDNPHTDLVARALSFAHNINAKVGKVSGAVAGLGMDLKNNRSQFKIGDPSSFPKYVSGFFESVKQFASNVGSRTATSHEVILQRRKDFNDVVRDSARIIDRTPSGQAVRKEIRNTYGRDIATNNSFIRMINDNIKASGRKNAKDHVIRGSFSKVNLNDVDKSGLRFYHGRGMFNYMGRDYDLSHLAPGNAMVGLIGFASAHAPSIIKGMGLDRAAQTAKTKDSYLTMSYGESIKISQKGTLNSLLPNAQGVITAGEDMFHFVRARAVQDRAEFHIRRGSTSSNAYQLAEDDIGRRLDDLRAYKGGYGPAIPLEDETIALSAMKRASGAYTDRGMIEPRSDEQMFMISGKIFVNKQAINKVTGEAIPGQYQTHRLGMQDGKQLRFNYFDRQTVGNWNKGLDTNFLEINRLKNEEIANDSNDPRYLSRMFMVRPKGNKKGFFADLNKSLHLELGDKHEKSFLTNVLDTFTRFWDTTNIRVFSAKQGALTQGVKNNEVFVGKGSATDIFHDQINYAKTIAGMREDMDVHIARQFDEDPDLWLRAATRIGDDSANEYLRKGMSAQEIREVARKTEERFFKYGRPPHRQMQEAIARMRDVTDATAESIFKPHGFDSKYESASIAGKFNLLFAKHRAVEEAYEGHPNLEEINLYDVRNYLEGVVASTPDPREALLLKGISLSRVLTDVTLPNPRARGTGPNAELRGTRGLNSTLSRMSRQWAKGTPSERSDLTAYIQEINSRLLESMRLNRTDMKADETYYGDAIREFAEEAERISPFNFSKKNLAIHGRTSKEASITLIARDKQDFGKVHGFGKMFKTVGKEEQADEMITITTNQMRAYSAMNAVNNVSHMIGVGFDQHSTPDVATYLSKLVRKRILPGFAMYQAYQVANAAVADSQLFNGTGLGEGITPFLGGFVAKGHIAAQGVMDVTGVTDAARYFEDLMPGSINSPLSGAVRGIGAPLAGMALGMKMGGPTGSMIGGAIGGAVSLLSAGGPLGLFGAYDITKGREQLIDEYLGNKDVAVKKARWWELGTSPMQGEGVSFFTKNWFAQMRADPKSTGSLYGSKLGEAASVMSKHFVEEQNMYSRPYPWSGGLGENVPMIGKTFQIGGGYTDLYKENAEYMMDPFAGHLSTDNSFTPITGAYSNFNLDNDTIMAASQSHTAALTGASQDVYGASFGDIQDTEQFAAATPSDLRIRARDAFKTTAELAGLRGWLSSDMIYGGATGQTAPFEEIPVLQSTSDMTSLQRGFWDSELGNMFGMGEFARRIVQRDPGWMEKINNIANLQPSWLPNDLQTGDAFTRVKQGEARLPGPGYETLNNVNYDVPGYAELLGKNPDEVFAAYTGQDLPTTPDEKYAHFGKPIAAKYADMLAAQNANAKRNVQFYNPETDFTAKADVVVKNESGSIPVKVKMVSQATFDRLGSARVQDSAEMNGILWASRSNTGSVIYIAPDGNTKQFKVEFDGDRIEEDMTRLRGVQETVKEDIMKHGLRKRYNMAMSYSQADKLKILSNVAPYSDEYFYALAATKSKMSLGLLSDEDKEKYFDAMDQRGQVIQKYDFYKPKFYDVGTPATVEEMQRQEEIGSKYNSVEKMIGAGWESMLSLRTPLSAKMIHYETPIARYERTVAYGKDFKSWNTPYSSFVDPLIQNSLAATNPIEGAIDFGTMGALLGGPGLAAVGAGIGLIHAPIAGGTHGIPDRVEDTRATEWMLDQAKYSRAKALLEQTQNPVYEKEMNQTMTAIINNGGRGKMSDIMRAIPKTEKGYFQEFAAAATIEERQRILQTVPEYIKPMLLAKWQGTEEGPAPAYDTGLEQEDPSQFSQALYDENLRMDDLRLKMYRNEGLDSREAGVGFYSQTHRLLRQGKLGDNTMTINNYSRSKNIQQQQKMQPQQFLPTYDINLPVMQ